MPNKLVSIDAEDMEFMEDFRKAHGVSVQYFIQSAIKDKIGNVKIKIAIEENKIKHK